ncbi:unnamed protein product [Prorocentrum cordatum]|uniref:Amine oxidase n=1 Tax=Prorocentrum cordatum TaxID=2364126 RepID=A0ABN9R8E4_9DINO|nr:unnamed protein product [Polarella glacialis]
MANAFPAGQRVEALWKGSATFQARILLTPASPSAFEEIVGQDAPQSSVNKGLLQWACTPDGDVHPHYLKPGVASDMTSLTPVESTGRRGPTRGTPRRAGAPVHGEDWNSPPQEFAKALQFALDMDFNDVLRAATPEAAPDQRSTSGRARSAVRSIGLTAAPSLIGSDICNLGSPTCTPTAALRELRGTETCYDMQPVKMVGFSPDEVAPPERRPQVRRGCCLEGRRPSGPGQLAVAAAAPPRRARCHSPLC